MPVGHPRFRSSISPASQTLSNILRLADPPFFFSFPFPLFFFSPLFDFCSLSLFTHAFIPFHSRFVPSKKINATQWTLIAHMPPAVTEKLAKVTYIDNEPEFRWALLQDQMAFDKLHEGVKKFAEDGETLKKVLRTKLQGA